MTTEAWPLLGRDSELAALVVGYARPADAGVLVVGAAGVGKTRLVRQAATRLHAAGSRVQRVIATRSAATIPFGAVSHLLPSDPADGDSRVTTFRRIADRMNAAGGRRRTVLVVDDGHLLDDPSAALVHHLAAHRAAFVLITARADADLPDAIAALWHTDLIQRLDLDPLSSDAIDALIDQETDGVVDAITRRHLHRICGGNPLFLREVLSDVERTQPAPTGILRWTNLSQATPRLAELVSTRLRAVSGPAREALDVIVCGEPVPVAWIEDLFGAGTTDAVERSGLAVTEVSGRRLLIRPAHPLYGETIRASMTEARAQFAWSRLATQITSTPMRRSDDRLRAGAWHLRSQRWTDPTLLLDAARSATARLDLDLATALARAAIQAGGGRGAALALAEILDRTGHYREAAQVLQDTGAAETGTTDWAIVRARTLYWGEGDVDQAEQTLAESADTDNAAGITRSWILLFSGRCRAALRSGRAVLGADPDPAETVAATAAVANAAAMLGEFDTAMAAHAQGLAATRKLGAPPWGSVLLDIGAVQAGMLSGRIGEAWQLVDDRFQAAADRGIPQLTGIWCAFRGMVARMRGDLDTAELTLRQAVALLIDTDPYHLLWPGFAELAGTLALYGRYPEAAGWMERADRHRHETSRLFAPSVALNRAWVAAASGDIPAAAALARESAESAAELEQPAFEMLALYDAARLGDTSVVRHLAQLTRVVEGTTCSVLARAAAALAEDDGERLDQATTELRGLDLHLHAAETANAAAQAHARAGADRRALHSAEKSAFLRQRCPLARTPLLESADEHAGLTSRERDIGRLAAGGRSSAEIAARLRLSVRTVDNHLGRIYQKLSIAGRHELADALGTRPT